MAGRQAVEGARAQGAARIIGIDKNERKRGKGEAFGMTDFINPDEDGDRKSVSELIKHSTAGMGVDYCFECTGFAPFINEALEATKLVYTLLFFVILFFHTRSTKSVHLISSFVSVACVHAWLCLYQGTGTAIVIGTSTATSVQINSLPLLCGRTLKGSIFGGLKPKTDLPVIIDKWMNKVKY